MKAVFLSAVFILSAICAQAQDAPAAGRVIDQGTVRTAPGIGGYNEIAYALAKGDVITLDVKANRLLERVMVVQYPQNVLQRVKAVRKTTTTFTVPEEGFVVIRFVNDRLGVTSVDYTVTRVPGPGTPADYNTTVRWERPTNTVQGMVPRRGAE